VPLANPGTAHRRGPFRGRLGRRGLGACRARLFGAGGSRLGGLPFGLWDPAGFRVWISDLDPRDLLDPPQVRVPDHHGVTSPEALAARLFLPGEVRQACALRETLSPSMAKNNRAFFIVRPTGSLWSVRLPCQTEACLRARLQAEPGHSAGGASPDDPIDLPPRPDPEHGADGWTSCWMVESYSWT